MSYEIFRAKESTESVEMKHGKTNHKLNHLKKKVMKKKFLGMAVISMLAIVTTIGINLSLNQNQNFSLLFENIEALARGEGIFTGQGPELFEPDYKIKKMGSYSALAHGKDERFGYTDVYVTNERIYALYSGKKQGQENDLYSNTIRVFSWTGEYLTNYELDREIMSFCIDDNGYIYGITTEPGAEIYKFKSVNS